MFDFFAPMLAMSANGYNFMNNDYSDLSPEEQKDMKLVDECLFNSEEEVMKAAGYIQLLLLELSFEPDKYEPEIIGMKMAEIKKSLSAIQRSKIDKFTLACIRCIGIYSDEAKEERRKNQEKQLILQQKGMKNNE